MEIFFQALKRSRILFLLFLALCISTVLFMTTSWSVKMRVSTLYEIVQLYSTDGQAPSRDRGFCHSSKSQSLKIKPVISIDKLVTPNFLSNFRNPCWTSEPGNVTLCLPYFYIAGFPKSGTTDLHKRITLHPMIMHSTKRKESHYLTRQLFNETCSKKYAQDVSSDCYANEYARLFFKWQTRAIATNAKSRNLLYANFTVDTGNISRQAGDNIDHPFITFPSKIEANCSIILALSLQKRALLDSSASTAWDANNWELIEENRGCSEPAYLPADILVKMNPHVLITMIMREPVQRAYSDYLYVNNVTSPEDFHHKVSRFLALYGNCLKNHSIRHCVYDVKNHENFSSRVRLEVGLYHVYIRDWLERLPRERFLFIRLEDYSKNVTRTVQDVFQFLQLPRLSQDAIKMLGKIPRANVDQHKNKRKPMLPETHKLLIDFYDAYNEKLAQLLGDERFTWRDVTTRSST